MTQVGEQTGVDQHGGNPKLADVSRAQLRSFDWLYRSTAAGFIWLVARVWLGYEWLNAGYQKLWGSERLGFWYNGGAAVKGYAAAGVAGSSGAHPSTSYGWWAAFLHNFVEPNASWIAKAVTLSEILIGIGLILGLFTGIAALGGVILNLIYMMSGTAGVNPAYALVGVLLVLAWRNAGIFGLDRFVLPRVIAWKEAGFPMPHRTRHTQPTGASV
jgi:thiosulfate dehydrogenase (quinone) large subunit